MLFVAATMILLHFYGNQSDIVLGIPISGRTLQETENILGMFVNTLALKSKVDETINFGDYLEQIKNMCIKAYENQEYPFDELIADLKLGGDMQTNPLFNVMLTFHQSEKDNLRFADSKIEQLDGNNNIVKFDLTFHIAYMSEGGEIGVEYREDLFDNSTIHRILKQYMMVLNQIACNKNIKISNIEIVTDDEKDLVNSINKTEFGWKNQDNVIDMFEKRVSENQMELHFIKKI